MEDDSDERYESGLDQWRALPVFKQSETLFELVEHIVDGIRLEDSYATSDYDKSMFIHHTQTMMENALTIPSRIAAAHNSDTYDIKMENAVLIKKAAVEILVNTRGLKMAGFKEVEYLELLDISVEAFRPVFAEWVATFDPKDFIINRWGLFNPPGVHYNDVEDYLDDDDLL